VVAVGKVKKILNIEAGLQMIALGMAICSEVCLVSSLSIENIIMHFLSIRIVGRFPKGRRMLKES
jgi:uncharacterized ferredoxin-like protein